MSVNVAAHLVRVHIDREAYESPHPTTGEALYALAALIGRMYVGEAPGEKHLLTGLAATLRVLATAELQLAHDWDDLRRLRGRAEPPPASSIGGGEV